MTHQSHRDAFGTTLWTDEAQFLSSKDDWNALAEATPDSTVFLRHEWCDSAWQWLKQNSTLNVLAIYDSNRLAGVTPLVLRYKRRRGGTARVLTFLAVPDNQHCDVLAAPADRGRVVEAVAAWLAANKSRWDILDLRYLNHNGDTAAILRAGLDRRGIAHEATPQGDNPTVALAGTWEEYYRRRSRRLKKGNNLIANKLKRTGSRITITRLSAGDDTNPFTVKTLEDLIDISSRSWKVQEGISLDFPGPNAFIRRITEHAAANRWLSVWLLTIDDKPVASEYQLHYHGHIHALRSDFDEELDELSPGTYLNWKMLEQLFNTDARLYLMGPGNNAYKQRWAEGSVPIEQFTAFSPSLRGRWFALNNLHLRRLYYRTRHRLKGAREVSASPDKET